MEPAVCFQDREIVDAGVAVTHQSVFFERPVFVSIGAKPIAVIVMVFVSEADRDPPPSESPQLLDQAVFEFPAPLAAQQGFYLVPANGEFRPISPTGVGGIGLGHQGWIATVPAVLGKSNLLNGARVRKWR